MSAMTRPLQTVSGAAPVTTKLHRSADRRWRGWLWRLPLAIVAGLLLDLSRPDAGVWPAAWLAAAGFYWSVYGASKRLALLVGCGGGSAFWLPHLTWLTSYLGPVPWLALAGAMTAWFIAFNVLTAATLPAVAQLGKTLLLGSALPVAGRQVGVAALLGACYSGLWLLRELAEATWPYGGFAWGRFAASFVDSPLAAAVSYWGVAATGALLMWVAVFPAALLQQLLAPRLLALLRQQRGLLPNAATRAANSGRQIHPPTQVSSAGRAMISTLAAVALLAAAQAALPAQHHAQHHAQSSPHQRAPHQPLQPLRIAAVQGNAKAGIFDNRENGEVFHAHLQTTRAHLAQLPDPTQLDLIIWPENGAEYNVLAHPQRMRLLTQIAQQTNAQLLLGTILPAPSRGATSAYNAAVTINTSAEPVARYDKYNPVPFGEYMPNREFFRLFAPDLVDLVQLEYLPGNRPAVTEIAGAKIGQAICFDIVFDRHTTQLIANEAELIVALTNNADFGRSDESWQQLALTKLQALSAGRALVNISTVGQSQIIDADGKTLASVPAFTPGVLDAAVPRYTHTTIASRYGAFFTALWGGGAAVLLLAAAWHSRSSRTLNHGNITRTKQQ